MLAVPEERLEKSEINNLSGKVPKPPIIEHQGLTQSRSNFSAIGSQQEIASSGAMRLEASGVQNLYVERPGHDRRVMNFSRQRKDEWNTHV